MKTRKIMVAAVLMVLIGSVSNSFAWPDRGGHGRMDYHRGPVHRMPYGGSHISVSRPGFSLSFGVTRVVTVPVVRTVEVVRPVTVEPVVVEPAPVEIVVWVRNDNGSLTSVRLTQRGPGYVGPLGEYYAQMPTEEQLKALYGLKSENSPYQCQPSQN